MISAAYARGAAVWSVRALLAVVILVSFSMLAPRAPQLALAFGIARRVLSQHAFDIGWLGAILEYGVASAAGVGRLAAFGGLAVIATLALVEWRARARAGTLLALAATIVAAFAFFDVLRVAGGGTSWLAAAALLLVLERAPGRHIFWAVPVVILWCNVSAQGIVAPGLVALIALGHMIDEGYDSPAVGRLWLVAAACAVATLFTPAGFMYVISAPLAARLDRDLLRIVPLAPDVLAPIGYRTAFFAIVMGGAALGFSQRRAVDGLLLAAGVVLTMIDGAYLPLLGILAAPILAASLQAVLPQSITDWAPREARRITAGAIALVAAFGIGFNLHVDALSQRMAPQSLIERLAADGRPHSVYCSFAEWCDYAIGNGNLRVWMDGRVERASFETRDMQRIVARVEPGWSERLRRSGIDAIVVRHTDALATLLGMSRDWASLAGDDNTQLFVRRAGSAR
jgi:hypothetical protein